MTQYEEYEMTEADIDKTINYLKTLGYEDATPEDAIAYLERLQAKVHAAGHVLSDEEMQELYNEFSSDYKKN
ncbi:hypothetical protein BGO17_00780 [Candidatus Saccharibacteria bacterium 49-20]|nr:hypothetical protein [Candidatus Saccharibacteria bacterium]OJU87519.1 MAG: hypothetical protein BGO17_00780 [Candidatus Saccharibacteria bacterium 49-20]OJU97085.1 MAG: hypothetical protein BGO18_02815 [Candidatus Saccharibacteria bacterium 47-87]